MIRKFIDENIINSKASRSIISAAFVITLFGLFSRIMGLLRDRFLASTFGAGDTLDIYYAAFRVPDLVYNLLILGALSAAFIPVFTSLISTEKDEEAWEMANGAMNLAIFFIVILATVLAIFAPFIMKVITPGFPDEKMLEVVKFSRIMFLSPLLLGISGIFGGILTSFRRFLIYSIAPIFYNIGIIVGILVFTKFLGPIGLAWGVVFGALLHMLIQYPAAKRLGFKGGLDFFRSFRNAHIKKIFHLMIPRTLGIAVNQFNLLVITVFASMLSAGSLAIFSFAQNLQSVPVGIIGASFAIAVFPTLAALIARNEKDRFVENFSHAFRQIVFFVIPISIFILILRAQIVRVLLGAGKFDWEDTVLTYQCLGIFVISLFAQSLTPLLARSFYAMHNTKTPFYIALVTEAVNIGIILFFWNFFPKDGQILNILGLEIEYFRIFGLAVAFTAAAIVQMLLLMFLLRTKFENLGDKKIIETVCKVSLISIISAFGIQASKYAVGSYLDMGTFLGIFSQLVISGSVGVCIFILLSQLFKVEEFLAFKRMIMRRVFPSRILIEEDVEDVHEVSGV